MFKFLRTMLATSAWCAVSGFAVSFADAAVITVGPVQIDFVDVFGAGNPADGNGYGSVNHDFRMSKYEISRGLIQTANTQGGLGITMENSGNYTITGPDQPATRVTWNAAARFVNWLNVNAGYPLAYKFASQPGDMNYNPAETILTWAASEVGFDPSNPFRNANSYFFLPSENEWYKAAYYDPQSGRYFDYPTGSDSVPSPVASGIAAGTAVYGQSQMQGPASVSQAGGLSPFGTMGQLGNAGEWMESAMDGNNDTPSEDRVVRGSAWFVRLPLVQTRYNEPPTHSPFDTGFRIASVPEPSSWLLLAAATVSGLIKRRRELP